MVFPPLPFGSTGSATRHKHGYSQAESKTQKWVETQAQTKHSQAD